MLATARTFTLLGVEAREVRVEVDVRQGLPSFTLVGLPDAAVRESRERVRAALANSGFEFPQQRITANLAPADLRKAGPGFDLAIAAAVLAATEQLPARALADVALAGELALDGSIRPVPGTLAMAEAARSAGVARDRRPRRLRRRGGAGRPRSGDPGRATRAALRRSAATTSPPRAGSARHRRPGRRREVPDLADLRGQPALRRALEVAAAGGHSLLISGPPGAGKSMAARRLPSILPPLGRGEAIEVARVASACGRPVEPAVAGRRPFRAPHHTISTAGLIGGGNSAAPGRGDARPPRGPLPRRAAASSAAARSRRCASRSRTGWCGSSGLATRSSSRAASSSSRRPTRARAGAGRARATAPATRARCAPTRRS